jgi:hypothetical protein
MTRCLFFFFEFPRHGWLSSAFRVSASYSALGMCNATQSNGVGVFTMIGQVPKVSVSVLVLVLVLLCMM